MCEQILDQSGPCGRMGCGEAGEGPDPSHDPGWGLVKGPETRTRTLDQDLRQDQDLRPEPETGPETWTRTLDQDLRQDLRPGLETRTLDQDLRPGPGPETRTRTLDKDQRQGPGTGPETRT